MPTDDALEAQPSVTGRTRMVGVMAWPVTHSLSPPMHNAAYAAAGWDMFYTPYPVHPDRVDEAVQGIRALGFIGMNVTIPHKQAVMSRLDEITPEARAANAVNTIQVCDDGRLVGHTTDAFGFLKSLEIDGDYSVEGKRVVLVGAGGAGCAMAVGLVLAGVRSICLMNRTESKRIGLAEVLEGLDGTIEGLAISHADPTSDEARSALTNADLLVNATSLGMKPDDPLPVDVAQLSESAFVYDAIYTPAQTRLLLEAKARGCRTLSGLGMLAYQGARSVEIWTGQWPDAELMKQVLARRLGLTQE